MSFDPEAIRHFEKAKLLSDEIAQAKSELDKNPGHTAALRLQRVQNLREQVQNQIRPYIISQNGKIE